MFMMDLPVSRFTPIFLARYSSVLRWFLTTAAFVYASDAESCAINSLDSIVLLISVTPSTSRVSFVSSLTLSHLKTLFWCLRISLMMNSISSTRWISPSLSSSFYLAWASYKNFMLFWTYYLYYFISWIELNI